MSHSGKTISLPILPDDLITLIIILSETKTFAKSRSLSSLWNSILCNPEVVRQHLEMTLGPCVLLQLAHPLMNFRTGRLHLRRINKKEPVCLRFPFPWEWFDIIGCFNGHIVARDGNYDEPYKMKIFYSNIEVWLPAPDPPNDSKFIVQQSAIIGQKVFWIILTDDDHRKPCCVISYSAIDGKWLIQVIPPELQISNSLHLLSHNS
ncbi:hypothetical protein PIB30_029811 [Stylosanthes scabra]|uniref:F-box domain-containing protein n=1 Tax=Stylosanthes scabra TaxID=79078 RepID=A0ABU6UDD3_9FABA|nr:hypothetical protein [Stylosanthes scabra]